ncbi:MAG: acyltransferase [Solirubrobacterales bacterium]
MTIDDRNTALEGMRALAALSVLTFHVWLYQIDGPIVRDGLADTVLFEARIGFVFFFLLSGYLIFRPFSRAALGTGRPVATGAYLKRRAARIVPAYYAAIVGAYVLIETAGQAPGRRSVGLDQLPLFFAFLQNYFPETALKLDAPTWTVVVEVAFYLIVPLVALLVLHRGGAGRQVAAIGALVAIGLAWNMLTHLNDWRTVATHVLPTFLPYFALGMLVAVIESRCAWRPAARASATLALLGAGAIVANGYWHATDRSQGLLIETLRDMPAALGMTALLVAAALGTRTGMAWLSDRPLVWIGTVSYGLFLWHVPLIVWLNGHGALPGGVVAGVAIVLPVALAVGAASWYALERPLIAKARGPVSATRSARSRS